VRQRGLRTVRGKRAAAAGAANGGGSRSNSRGPSPSREGPGVHPWCGLPRRKRGQARRPLVHPPWALMDVDEASGTPQDSRQQNPGRASPGKGRMGAGAGQEAHPPAFGLGQGQGNAAPCPCVGAEEWVARAGTEAAGVAVYFRAGGFFRL